MVPHRPDGGPFTYTFGRRTYDLSSRTYVMGVLNVTPDSFSDGGMYESPDAAVERALSMIDEGADFIDVGGESTRPKGAAYGNGSEPVPIETELGRVLPVIERLAGKTDVPISVDTYKAEVARRALEAGAVIVNDISGFRFDPAMPDAIADHGASAVVMHILGTPRTMQDNPVYRDLFGDIEEYLHEGLVRGARAGIHQMFVDPGIGFGKTLRDNLRLMGGLHLFARLGYPVLVGPSRKSFIGSLLNQPVTQRLEGTIAAVVACVLGGAHVVRVHDVRQVKRAVLIADAIRNESVKE